MRAENVLLVALFGAFLLASVLMGLLHPDRDWPSDEKVVTMFSSADPTNTKIFNEAAERFEAKHADEGYRVRHIRVPWTGYARKIQFLEVAKLQADVIYMDQRDFPRFYPKGMLEDLNPRISADPELSVDPYFEAAVKLVAFDGKQYALPLFFSPVLVFYNKTEFEKAGVPLPRVGWTYTEFLDAAKRLTRDEDGDGVTDFFGVVGLGWNQWMGWVWREGGRIFSEDLSRCLLDSPEAIRGLTFLYDLTQTHKVTPRLADLQSLSSGEMFKTGRAGMIFASRFVLDTYKAIEGFEWGVASVPLSNNTGLGTTSIIVDSISLAAHGKNKKVGWELIKFLLSEEMMQVYADVGTGLPAMTSVAERTIATSTVPGDELFLQVPEDSRYFYVPTTAPKAVAIGMETVSEVFVTGRMSPEEVARKVVEIVHKGLERAKKRERRYMEQ